MSAAAPLKTRSGFSLIELVIALGLSAVIMMGVITMSASIVRQNVETAVKAGVTGKAVYGVQRLQRDLEDSTSLRTGFPSNPQMGMWVGSCTNWTNMLTGDGRIDRDFPAYNAGTGAGDPECQGGGAGAGQVRQMHYCITSLNGGSMYRYRRRTAAGANQCPTSCDPTFRPPNCGNAAANTVMELVVASVAQGGPGIYAVGSTDPFSRSADQSGVMLSFSVGNPNQVANSKVGKPATHSFTTVVSLQKSYMSTSD